MWADMQKHTLWRPKTQELQLLLSAQPRPGAKRQKEDASSAGRDEQVYEEDR